MARRALGIYPTGLAVVAERLGLSLDHHNAASDAAACAQIVLRAHARRASCLACEPRGTDPIRVDFLPTGGDRISRARIGLTLAPGRKDDRWDRDLAEDVRRLRGFYSASLLVSLVEDHELKANSGSKTWPGKRIRLGCACVVFLSRTAGSSRRAEDVAALVQIVLAVVQAGGTGRDPLPRRARGEPGCWPPAVSSALGQQGDAAVRIVRKARHGAIQTIEVRRGSSEALARPGQQFGRRRPWPPDSWDASWAGRSGDALGYPVEFHRTPAEIERVLGPVLPEGLPHAPGTRAPVSDDTQMTLFTAEGLIRAFQRSRDQGICSPEAVLLNAYHRWLSMQTPADAERWRDPLQRGWLLDIPELHARRAPGNTCLTALTATLASGALPSVATPPNDSKGCGAVMRSAPIGLAAADVEEAFRRARDAAVLTHGHPSGYLSAGYFAGVVHQLARDVSAGRCDEARGRAAPA